MLGPLTLRRQGVALQLPGSRKVRALFGYLALSPNAVPRSQLCELLWDVPNDPRGELRWCLSKIRSLVDEPDRQRVTTSGDTVGLDISDCSVDTTQVAQAVQEGLATLPAERLRELVALFNGEILEDVDIDRSPAFNNWLIAQRRRFRACRAALLERLVDDASDDEAFGYLEQWLELAPFDQRVHKILLEALARRGRIREGEEHLAAVIRLFESEGLEAAPIRDIWRTARTQADAPPPRQPAASAAVPSVDTGATENVVTASRRASIAVMPFVDRGAASASGGGAAGALAHDVITRLAKLRTLFVIAQGTVFALHERGIGAEDAGRTLNVDYVVSGSMLRQDKRITVAVELAETRTARIVWAEVFNRKLDDAFLVLDEIGNRIVASIASEIETIERNRAILRPPNSLDAWESYHRGLWHMYRFSPADNERAQTLLRDGGSSRSDLLARLCRPVVHAFPECLPGLDEARAGSRSRLRGGRTKSDGRRPRPGGALGDGPCAVAARQSRSVHRRTRAVGRSQPEFRARRITICPLSIRPRAIRCRPFRRPTTRAISVRSIRCCSACSAPARWRWCVSADSMRPPSGASRRRLAPMRLRISRR